MHDRLVVGYDGSDASLTAARWAADEAATRGAAVHIVSSYSIPFAADPYGMTAAYLTPEELEGLRAARFERVSSAASGIVRDHPHVGIDFDVLDEEPINMLLEQAKTADLIVVGSSGAGAVRGILLGSVVSSLLHECPCPVAVVPATIAASGDGVVVGVDGSEQSRSALTWAAAEAERRGVSLHLVHAWEYPYVATTTGRDFAEVDAGKLLEDSVRFARERCSTDVVGSLVEGSAVAALLSAGGSAGFVVVGSRGRGGFRSMLFGSVAHGVCAHAPVPVVVVH